MSNHHGAELIACHECDHLHEVEAIPEGARANCAHCGAFLYRNTPGSLDRSLALYLAALVLFLIANCFPFLSLELGGRVVENVLLSGGLSLYRLGMGELGLLIFLTSILFPFLVITGMLYLIIPARIGFEPRAMGPVYRMVYALTPWSLIGVFMLAVLISIVKLQDLATVMTGISLYALLALLIVYTAARASFDPRALWAVSSFRAQPLRQGPDGEYEPFLNCHVCGLLTPYDEHTHSCPRCNAPIHYRKVNSISRTWALIFSATVLLVPANVYPVMTVIRFGRGEPNTILSGIVHLIESGMWGLGLIVFVASIVVPFLKLIVLTFLLISIEKGWSWAPRDRTLLYRVTEVVGAWSMVDIFLVGLLSALVSLEALSTIKPGIGATFFGAVVVITMFAAQSFDPRLIWDSLAAADGNDGD